MQRRLLATAVLLVTSLALVSGVGGRAATAAGGGSISGVVYFDTDMDGQRDPDEPGAPGQTIELHGGKGDLVGQCKAVPTAVIASKGWRQV